jgi:hypothetical protein
LLIGAALTLGAAPALAGLTVPTPCAVIMTPDRVTPAGAYHARLHLTPTCQAQTFRVRKSSTLNTRRAGAPYQPVRPDGTARFGFVWSWTISRAGSTVPEAELWSLTSWRWESYQPRTWNARTRTYGVWAPIPSAVTP